MGSPENLKQVFLNLIINARDVLDEGGKIKINIFEEDENLIIEFSDNGPGIPSEHIAKIFEPFYTTKDSSEGTGLGLSVCYGIIKNHNGSITFKNLDPGGCFEIKLPLAKSDETS